MGLHLWLYVVIVIYMEETTYTISVPEVFARDYWNRGNIKTQATWQELVIKHQGSRVVLQFDLEQIQDLWRDANYYATSNGFKYPDMFGLVSSARAVRNAITKQIPEVAKK